MFDQEHLRRPTASAREADASVTPAASQMESNKQATLERPPDSQQPRMSIVVLLLGVFQGMMLTALTPFLFVAIMIAPSAFLVYGEQRHINFYFPGKWPWWLPPMFFATAYRTGSKRGGRWGIVVAVRHTDDQMRQDGRIAARYVRFLVLLMRRCQAAALAGQLPNFVGYDKGGTTDRQIPAPFVSGDTGTLYAMLKAALRGAEELGQDPSQLTIAVPGGAGRIGGRLVDLLQYCFKEVIAIDTRYTKTQHQGVVIKTDKPEWVRHANLILALTPKGSDLEPLLPFVRTGMLFMDDTHPDIPKRLRRALQENRVILRKPSVTRNRFRWWPINLPGYRNTAIPGCLVEAFVVAACGRNVLNDFNNFVTAADSLGFEPILFEHPDVV